MSGRLERRLVLAEKSVPLKYMLNVKIFFLTTESAVKYLFAHTLNTHRPPLVLSRFIIQLFPGYKKTQSSGFEGNSPELM